LGLLIMNSGEPMIGSGKLFRAPGNLDILVSKSRFTLKKGVHLPIASVFYTYIAIINIAI
jgi:hypothetical protein